MIYILFILWFPISPQSGKAIAAVEFNTLEQCHAASREVGKQGTDLLRSFCIAKGQVK